MKPIDKLKLIKAVATKFQNDQSTKEINLLLSEYGIKTKDVNFVRNKKDYVTETLTNEPIDIIIKIAKDLGLKVPENILSYENDHHERLEKIFISHSSLDFKFVEQLIETLEAIGVPSNRIFCSSFEGYGVKLGSDFLETLKRELNSKVLVLFVLSSNFYSSVISLCEMGATWVKTNKHIPILIPPFDYQDIKGVMPTTHGMKINEKEKFNSFKEQIEVLFNLEPVVINIWERKRDKILTEIKLLLDSENYSQNIETGDSKELSGKQEVISDREALNKRIKDMSSKEWPNNFEMQLDYIQRQHSAIEMLQKHNPIDIDSADFNIIRKKAQEDWPDNYEMQLDLEQRQVESLRRLNKF